MKNLLLSLTAIVLLTLLQSCTDKYMETFTANVPEYMSLAEWRALDILPEGPKQLTNTGKIYIYGDFLFIVSRGAGVHIVDNADPAAPTNVAFLPIPGCVDVAVRNNMLYADAYFDLLAFDIVDPASPALSCRMMDVFDFNNWTSIPGYDPALPIQNYNIANGVITGWSQQEISEEASGYSGFLFGNNNEVWDNSLSSSSGNPGSGMGGSMAQFAITGSYLYVLRPASITALNLAAEVCPVQSSVTDVAWNAETIFPFDNHLFLGTTSGMMIFDLVNPGAPGFVSQISHLTACDPVAVQGNRAYVTVRTGTACQGNINRLLVIDISDEAAPATLAEYDLSNPHGLGIDGTTLFVCDGADGLKVYNAADDYAIADNLLAHYGDIVAYDVIPYEDVLIMSAEEGIYQYDYSNPEQITALELHPGPLNSPMRTIFSTLLLLLTCIFAKAQGGYDVIYMKDGAIFKGQITEYIPSQQVTIILLDGRTLTMPVRNIINMKVEGNEVIMKKVEDNLKGYFHNSLIGPQFGHANYNNPRIGFAYNMVNGYKWRGHHAGIGLGMENHAGKWYAPIYADYSYHPWRGDFRPLIGINGGAMVPINNARYSDSYQYNYTRGAFIGGRIGFAAYTGAHFAFLLNITYRYIHLDGAEYIRFSPFGGTNTVSGSADLHRVGVMIGFVIN